MSEDFVNLGGRLAPARSLVLFSLLMRLGIRSSIRSPIVCVGSAGDEEGAPILFKPLPSPLRRCSPVLTDQIRSGKVYTVQHSDVTSM